VLRFIRPTANLEGFLPRFDKIAAETEFAPMKVQEIVLTSETKPYMRGGETSGRFRIHR
jgi:hypothetical protein